MAKIVYPMFGDWQLASGNSAPGYFGAKRDQKVAEYDNDFGSGNWAFAWLLGDELRSQTVNYEMACELYELSYYHYLNDNPEILHELVLAAGNVYDDAPSNVQSGFDYNHQETNRTHIQDIAIRNAVYKLGRCFEGRELVQIRGKEGHSLSKVLSPGVVPYHNPIMISTPSNLDELYSKRWWKEGSVEDFYQRNKRIIVKR